MLPSNTARATAEKTARPDAVSSPFRSAGCISATAPPTTAISAVPAKPKPSKLRRCIFFHGIPQALRRVQCCIIRSHRLRGEGLTAVTRNPQRGGPNTEAKFTAADALTHPILTHLNAVQAERESRRVCPDLHARVQAVKDYQQRRFAATYADLLADPRYRPAARFFLDELYGPADFSQRDAQFARVVPALVRLFPENIVATVATLTTLHALSENLDSEMGGQIASTEITAADYTAAWQATARAPDRHLQIDLMLSVGSSLDKLTRKPLVRASLLLMRGPARAAGLGELQTLLETGFEAFRSMNGAQEFLATVRQRETDLCNTLFGQSGARPDDCASVQP